MLIVNNLLRLMDNEGRKVFLDFNEAVLVLQNIEVLKEFVSQEVTKEVKDTGVGSQP